MFPNKEKSKYKSEHISFPFPKMTKYTKKILPLKTELISDSFLKFQTKSLIDKTFSPFGF